LHLNNCIGDRTKAEQGTRALCGESCTGLGKKNPKNNYEEFDPGSG
jgi:hypothetical protein